MTQEFTEQLAKWEMHLYQLGYRKVVLCKDCKWNDSKEWVDCHMLGMRGRKLNNYCSDAERKTE